MYDPLPRFDWPGFKFSLKCLTVVAVFVLCARFGPGIVATILAGTKTTYRNVAASIRSAPVQQAHAVNILNNDRVTLIAALLTTYQPQISATISTVLAQVNQPVPTILDTSIPLSPATTAPRIITTFDLAAHIPATGKAIAADLAGMKVQLFEDGAVVAEYPIISKGKEGSRWQTPVGAYTIESKEKNHLSSIGDVYMPYSMEFYGNFFIHGWPYYPDSTPVRLGFTGGCIRLSTPDAAKVFAFADIRTPILVYESSADPLTSHSITAARLPDVSAESYLVADVNTGEVFAEKNASVVRPIASLTKLITSIVANEAITYDRPITITSHVMTTLGETLFKKGDVLTATELQYPLLMQSDNGAAVALADSFGSSGFISLMNAKASALGMNDTHFEDPHGISEHNVSSAEDLFRLAHYFYNNQKFLLNITRLPQKVLAANGAHKTYQLYNFNVFADRPEFLGGKTGSTTAARQTMTALFSYADQGDPSGTSTMAIIVLGSDNRKKDVSALYDWTLGALNKAPTFAEAKN